MTLVAAREFIDGPVVYSVCANTWSTALLLVLAGNVIAQPLASVGGFVIDANTGETLLSATVVVSGTGRGAATNLSGYYVIAGLDAGVYTIRGSYIGYVAAEQEIVIEGNESLRLDIMLTPDLLQIDEVVVTADRDDEGVGSLGVDRMPVTTIKQLPSVFEPDVFRSLQLLPGVASASDYSSGLYIRGGNPGQTLILLDRTSVYNPTHVFGFFSTFNPDAIKDVQLFKGAFPASYGGRIGSVLDIHNKDGDRHTFHTGLTLGILASRAFIEGPHSRGSYMLAVRRSTLEPLLALLSDVNGVPEAFYFADINSKINFDVSPNDRLSLSFYLGQDALRLSFLADTSLRLRYGNRTASVNWMRLFSSTLFSNFTLTASQYRSQPDVHFGGTSFRQDNRVNDYSLKADLEFQPDSRHSVEGGFWVGRLELPLRNFFDGDAGFSSNIVSLYAAAYVQDKIALSPVWTAQVGLRASYLADGSHMRLAPRVSLEYRPDPSLSFQTGAGRYYQYQTLITNESFSGFDVWLASGNGVRPAFGDQVVLGARAQLMQTVTLDIEAYYRTMRQLFEVDPYLADASGLAYHEYFTFGRGAARGIELKLERPQQNRLSGFLAATFGDTHRMFPDLNLDRLGEPQQYPPKHDRRVNVTGVANYSLTPSWNLTAVVSVASGQAYTKPSAQYRLTDTEYVTGNQSTAVLLSSGLNNARLPTYHRVDVGAANTGRFFGLADYEWQLQVINVYAQRNTWFVLHDFAADGTVDSTTVPQIPIPLPNVSFTLKF